MKSFSQWIGPAVLMGAVLSAPAFAQDAFRFGVVNPDRVMREAPVAKAAQTRLEQEFLKRERDLKDQEATLKTASEKLEREAPTLSEAQRTTRQRQLVDQDRDFQRKSREFQEDLNLRRSEELQKVYESAQRAIKQVAEAEKYDVILQDAVYVNPKHDITEKVIKALNASTGGK
ncbi:OmpH family outer membrane protein [Xenophilus arseniciresistens]|uniref:OmpH family outer membrane protein n=1 Tax=Xenophilus arseniciresistens TaxID=1283306 RepID=A0AAE3NBW9_9BURK|nr:OmpH family outer membrane protein [Xenophilus arseniciresistens]MDA7417492.1 OmpH family outer membrane protein [Xenophilus arseniciresistens]